MQHGKTATGVQALKLDCTQAAAPQVTYAMLLAYKQIDVHRSQMHTLAASILAVCISQSAHITVTHFKLDCKPWQ